MSWSTSFKTILGMSSGEPSETPSAGPSAGPLAGRSKSKAPSWFQPFLDRPHDSFDSVKYFNLVMSCIGAYRNIRALMKWIHDEQDNMDRRFKRWFLKFWEWAGMIPRKRKRDRAPHKNDSTLKCFKHLSKPWGSQNYLRNPMDRPSTPEPETSNPTPEPETSKQAPQRPVPSYEGFAGTSRPENIHDPNSSRKGKMKADEAADGDIRKHFPSSSRDEGHLRPRKHYSSTGEDFDFHALG